MKIYIDFDGVILDTDTTIDNIIKDNNIDKKEYIRSCDWDSLLNNTDVINNSIEYLRESKLDINLLSKISTLEEGIAKVKYLRDNGVDMNIHLVPTKMSKSDIVNSKGNILIDDKIYNLDEWDSKGGISIFFNKDNNDIDHYGKTNTKYEKTSDLSMLLSDNEKDD